MVSKQTKVIYMLYDLKSAVLQFHFTLIEQV